MSARYGPRLDANAYYRQVVALYRAAAKDSGRQHQTKLRRDELELTIDHKLGLNFPVERRAALWAAQQRLHSWRLPMMLFGLVRRAMGSRRPVEEPLYRLAISKLGKVLAPDELSLLLDLPPKHEGRVAGDIDDEADR